MSRKRQPPGPPVTADDAALFREAIGEVRPLPALPDAPGKPRPAPRPRRLEIDEQDALRLSREPSWFELSIGGDEPLSFRRPEFPEKQFKALRRGQFSVADELDLHHLRASEAERLLKRFLAEARYGERLCVRIIHGKGQRSAGEGSVLKGLVDLMLRQRADVLAFASAPEALGGTGATLVLLARRRVGERDPREDDTGPDYF